MTTNKNIPKVLLYTLIGFSFIITLNALIIRYPVNVVIPLIKTIGLTSIIFIYGFFTILLFKIKDEKVDFIDACGIGLIITTFYFYFISFLKILIPFTIFLFYFMPLILFYFLSRKKKAFLQITLKSFLERPYKEYFPFIFPFIYASLPSSFYDSLVYHLGIPNFYLQNQGFIPTPHFFFANTSIYYEISLIPAVFAGDMVPQLFHFLLGMVFLLSISDLAFRFFRLEKRFILLIILLSMPITVFLLCTVKNDLLSAFFIVLGIKYYLENKFKRSALCWGFAIGIKYFNILPLGIFLLLVFIKQKKFNFKRLIIFGIIITTILLPLFIKNYIFTQNPVFPFLGGIFPSVNPYFDASRFAVMKTDVGRLIHTWQDLLKLPYTLSFYELGSGGLIGVQFLIFLPFLIIIRKKAGNSFLFVFALLFLAVGSCFTSQVRFMYAACTILAIFTAFIYQSLSQAGPKIMKILFFIIIGLNLVASFGYHERIYRAYYLYSGKSSDIDQYIQEVFPSYPAFNFVNKNLPENARILLVGEARNYYLKRPYYASSGIDYAMIKKYLSPGTTFAEFKAALKKDKITHIIFNAGEFQRLKREYRCLDDYEETLLIAFFKQLQPIFINPNGNLYVYETI